MGKIKKGNNVFYIGDSEEEAIAEISYVPTGEDRIIIDHTYVSNELRGQGIAKELLDQVANYARTNNKKVIPLCPYAKVQMERYEEYHDLLDK